MFVGQGYSQRAYVMCICACVYVHIKFTICYLYMYIIMWACWILQLGTLKSFNFSLKIHNFQEQKLVSLSLREFHQVTWCQCADRFDMFHGQIPTYFREMLIGKLVEFTHFGNTYIYILTCYEEMPFFHGEPGPVRWCQMFKTVKMKGKIHFTG